MQAQPVAECALDSASITFDGTVLTARTGRITRRWNWTGRGFLTSAIAVEGGREWRLSGRDPRDADWLLPVCEGINPEGRIESVRAEVDDDDGFTSKHVAFTAEMTYPEAKLALRFGVWAFPGAPGLRIGLHIRALDGYHWDARVHRIEISEATRRVSRLSQGHQRQDILPMAFKGTRRRMFGYHSETQQRNDPFLDLMLEAVDEQPVTHPSVCMWANALCVEDDAWGIGLLKESHKCVNRYGHDGGAFLCLPGRGVESHGWGILPQEIDLEWRPAWATWCIVYPAGDRSRQTAFKQFDRIRYPLGPRDIYVQANTWGSSQGFLEHREAASERNVLREIDSCADLGIDVLQIDDGWQGNDYNRWSPAPDRYPDGWSRVRVHARSKGVCLGLWLAAMPPTLEDLERNAREGGFVSYKLDFAHLNGRQKIDELMRKVRAFIKGQDHAVRVNWDLTEVEPRYGYFFGREYGAIYLENRKPVWPRTTTYRPATVLRDLWQIAHYCNLLKFQGSVQNIDMCDPLYTDAAAYSHAYCTAITLMSSPLFFCETHFYDDAARAQIRPLLAAYKKVREDLFRGLIHPLGEKPDGSRWTGFECALPEGDRGYLTVFREARNPASSHAFTLTHLAGQTLELKDLLTGETYTRTVSADGHLILSMDAPASFRFLAWRKA